MNDNTMVFCSFCLFIGFLVISFFVDDHKKQRFPNETTYINSKGIKIDMPEEIPIATKGDTLVVLEVRNEVIYMGFKH